MFQAKVFVGISNIHDFLYFEKLFSDKIFNFENSMVFLFDWFNSYEEIEVKQKNMRYWLNSVRKTKTQYINFFVPKIYY